MYTKGGVVLLLEDQCVLFAYRNDEIESCVQYIVDEEEVKKKMDTIYSEIKEELKKDKEILN